MSSFQALGAHTDDDIDDYDETSSSSSNVSGFTLGIGYGSKQIVDLTDNKSVDNNTINDSEHYFSFQQLSSNKQNNSINNNTNNIEYNQSLISSNSDSGNSALYKTDFAPKKGISSYNGYSMWKIFRIKYLLLLTSFLFFVSILTYFLTPRAIECNIEITIQKLQIASTNISMTTEGFLYITNPNYLPIIIQSMRMDIYFNYTETSTSIDINSNEKCEEIYLFSQFNEWNEAQNQQIYNVPYPFFLQINKKLTNKTVIRFKNFIKKSCKNVGFYVLNIRIYPQYKFTESIHQISFQTNTHANQGCGVNNTYLLT